MDRKETGRRGETEACAYLTGLGHTILERNWRTGHRELDIISCDARGLHFVEVKTRNAPVMAEPEENVRSRKRLNLTRAAAAYLRTHGKAPFGADEVFFDVISVVFDGGNASVEYFPQAFIPMWM